MIDTLYSTDKLDFVLKTKLKDAVNDLKEYIFEGENYNKINFNRFLVFYDDRLFEEALLDIKPVDRWINAYFWYSTYINELKKQGISIENHKQPRFKLLEQIDYVAGSNFDWSIIEKIENKYDLK
jgi:hypothetical protein